MANRRKDKVGEVYGQFTIVRMLPIDRTKSRSSQNRVLVKCECGSLKNVSYKDLKRKKSPTGTRKCGCKANSYPVQEGDLFGDWKVLGIGYSLYTKKIPSCLVQHTCGFQKIVANSSIHKHTPTCSACKGASKILKREEALIASLPQDTDQEYWVEFFRNPNYLVSNLGGVFSKGFNFGYRNIFKNRRTGEFHFSELNRTRLTKKSMGYSGLRLIYEAFNKEIVPYDKYQFILRDPEAPVSLDNIAKVERTNKNMAWPIKLMNLSRGGVVRGRRGDRILEHSLTPGDIIDQYNKQGGLSYYLNLPMDLSFNCQLRAISIERIDNSKGYTPDNICLATRFENRGRSDSEFTDMVEFAKEIKR